METPVYDQLTGERPFPQLLFPPTPPLTSAKRRHITKVQNTILRNAIHGEEVTDNGVPADES